MSTPSSNADRKDQTDKSEQEQIAPQTGELDAEQLDGVVGGGGGLVIPPPRVGGGGD